MRILSIDGTIVAFVLWLFSGVVGLAGMNLEGNDNAGRRTRMRNK